MFTQPNCYQVFYRTSFLIATEIRIKVSYKIIVKVQKEFFYIDTEEKRPIVLNYHLRLDRAFQIYCHQCESPKRVQSDELTPLINDNMNVY